MNKFSTIKEHLLSENSKNNWVKIAQRCIQNKEDLDELIRCFLYGSVRIVQRSSQCISKINDLNPSKIETYLPQIIKRLHTNSTDAYKRNTFRILQDANITEDLQSKVFDLGILFLTERKEAIAILVFSMTVLRQICEVYPELSPEVIGAIEIILTESSSAGIQSRGKKELIKLRKLSRLN